MYFRQMISVLFFLSSLTAYAQENKKIDGFYLNLKVGAFDSWKVNSGFCGGIEAAIIRNKFIYSVDILNNPEFEIFGPYPLEHYNQVGVMIGSFVEYEIFRLQYQGGAAFCWGTRRTDKIDYVQSSGFFFTRYYVTRYYYTPGIVGEIGFRIMPLQYISIGLDFHANLNSEAPVYGSFISLELGKVRDKIK